MIRVRCEGRFPSYMQARQMKYVLSQIVYRFLRDNHSLPTRQHIQSEICRITQKPVSECNMIMYMYTFISQQEELRTVLNNSMSASNVKKRELLKKEKKFFKKLKRVKCKGTCTICLKEGFKGIRLSCGHEFHKSCLRKNYSYNKNCPNCRKPIKIDEVKVN